jgi:clan AA aspartic protease (TIGR02281 family)
MLATLPAVSETIQLEQLHGVFMLPVRINDAVTVPFVLDSGAAEVAITEDVFSTLRRTGTVEDSDFIGTGTYTLADGSRTSSARYVLHKMSVGNHVITDVVANVVSAKGDPLLGQSFLSKLPAWAIDNNRHMLVLQDQLKAPPGDIWQDMPVKSATAFFGRCRYQLIAGFFPCGNLVAYNLLKNGRSLLTFWSDQAVYTLSGGKDRQPNLENFYLSIDTFTLKLNGKSEAIDHGIEDHGIEGECHFSLNRDATRFFYIRCDVYNRTNGAMYNFYLDRIEKFKKVI